MACDVASASERCSLGAFVRPHGRESQRGKSTDTPIWRPSGPASARFAFIHHAEIGKKLKGVMRHHRPAVIDFVHAPI